MTAINGAPRAGLVQRVQGILLRPKVEWDVIDAEPATVQGLYTGYAMILAAIPPVASAIGAALITMGLGFIGLAPAIVTGLISYVLSLVGVFIVALIADALAPSFDGQKNQIQAFKAVIYAYTAAWVSGICAIIPFLGILGIIVGGLYSLYLLYLGLPKLMKVPEAKALGYTAVVVVLAVILQWVIAMIIGAVMLTAGLGAAGLGAAALARHAQADRISGSVAGVDLAKLDAASRQMQASAAAMQAQAAASTAAANGAAVKGAPAGVDPNALKALLPAGVNGFAQKEVSAESAGAAGFNTSHAEAKYEKGDASMTVELTDTGAMAGLAGMASAFNVNSSKQTATGYEKVGNIDGRMTTEEYDRASKHGKYSVLAASRFVVEANGDNVSIDDLKAAVSAVGVSRVEQLAKR